MAIVFYISGHGFGHASRQVEIINALQARRPDVRVIVRTAVAPDLLSRTLRGPYDLRLGPCDAGIIQSSSLAHDDEATCRAVVGFYRDFEAHVAREVRDLSTDAVRLIVGDIPPLAFAVAARLGTPSVAIANFTWDWIYETHPGLEGDLDWLLPTIRGAYRSATAAWQLPFAGGFEVFPSVSPLSLVARRPSRSRADTRRHLGLPPTGPIALLSFGGYGLPALDFGSIDCLDRWTIVTTDRVTSNAAPRPAGVQRIDERQFAGTGFRYEDLVGAVDVVLTKPGYGIVAECVTAGTAMVYTSRGAFREYAVLTAALPRLARARFLPQAALFAGAWRASLDGVLAQPAPPDTIASDGADRAADQLAGFLQDRM